MQTLTDSEIDVVAGGIVWFAVLVFTWSNADKLRDFADGFVDGLLD